MGIADQIVERPVASGAQHAADFEYAYGLARLTLEPFVVALAGEWPDEYQRHFFQKGFDDPGMRILMLGDKPIGCFCISEQEDSIKLCRVYIDPAFQGYGLGKHIVGRALEKAHEAKLPLELEVLRNNDPAIDFWWNRGFYFYGEHAKGWVQELLMRSRETDQYLPGASFRVLPPQLPGFRPA